MPRAAAKDVDRYISGFPPEVQVRLNELRRIIRKAAPDAEEGISYQMPAYKQNGIVAYFAGFQNHVSYFPAPGDDPELVKAMAPYRHSKGTLRFPLDRPVPSRLITKVVRYWMRKNAEKAKAQTAVRRRAAQPGAAVPRGPAWIRTPVGPRQRSAKSGQPGAAGPRGRSGAPRG